MSLSPFSEVIYKIHSSVNKDGYLYVYLVNMKQPFSTQIVHSIFIKDPFFIFDKKILVNDLNLYTYPLSDLFENKILYTHTNYNLLQICDIEEIIIENNNTKISIEYKNKIIKELNHFIKILQKNNIKIISVLDLHIDFVEINNNSCC